LRVLPLSFVIGVVLALDPPKLAEAIRAGDRPVAVRVELPERSRVEQTEADWGIVERCMNSAAVNRLVHGENLVEPS
jgi:hypothetical protein